MLTNIHPDPARRISVAKTLQTFEKIPFNANIDQINVLNQLIETIGNSKNSVDGSTAATTATLPLKIIDFVDGPDSEVGDEFTDVLVMFNVGHQLLNTTGIG